MLVPVAPLLEHHRLVSQATAYFSNLREAIWRQDDVLPAIADLQSPCQTFQGRRSHRPRRCSDVLRGHAPIAAQRCATDRAEAHRLDGIVLDEAVASGGLGHGIGREMAVEAAPP